MRVLILVAVLLVARSILIEPAVAAGQTPGMDKTASATLASLRDQYRPLLVFAPSEKDRRFVEQARWFAQAASDMHSRQVLFMAVAFKKETDSAGVVSGLQTSEFSPDEASAVRRKFGIAQEDFFVILLGKDGGEKFRTHAPVTMERSNAVIDAMPMRQQEVRNGNSK